MVLDTIVRHGRRVYQAMRPELALRRALSLRDSVTPEGGLTPLQFMNRYYQLKVVLSDNTLAEFKVHKYRINETDPGVILANRIRHLVARAEWGAARGHLDRRWRTQSDSPVSRELRELTLRRMLDMPLRTTFNGKASPRDISLCLTVLSVSGRINEAVPGSSRSEREKVHDYIGTYIGLDCSGFVNNYFIATGQYADNADNRNVTIQHNYGTPRSRLHFLPARPQTFMLVWRDFGHIAMIHDWGPGGYEVDLQVVESGATMHGLRESIYEIRNAPTGGDPTWELFSQYRGRTQSVYMVGPLGSRT